MKTGGRNIGDLKKCQPGENHDPHTKTRPAPEHITSLWQLHHQPNNILCVYSIYIWQRCSVCRSFTKTWCSTPCVLEDCGGLLSAGGARAADSDIGSVRPLNLFQFSVQFLRKKKNRRLILMVDDQFCFVLFSFDRRFPKNVKTYSTEELNILVLYVFIHFLESACQKRIRQSKIDRQNASSCRFF